MMYPCKSGKNLTAGSQDIAQTRKCQANANCYANTNAIADMICAKNNIFPSPLVGGT